MVELKRYRAARPICDPPMRSGRPDLALSGELTFAFPALALKLGLSHPFLARPFQTLSFEFLPGRQSNLKSPTLLQLFTLDLTLEPISNF